VNWGRELHCPSHLESEVKLWLINIQCLVELECSRGVKYWISMYTHTVRNIACFLIILRWRFLCCLLEFTSSYLLNLFWQVLTFVPFFFSFCSLHTCKLIKTLYDYMFSISGFQTMGFWNKNSHYSSSGMMHLQEKDWWLTLTLVYCLHVL